MAIKENSIRRGVTLALADCLPHPKNYNQHSDAQVAALKDSLATFGQVAAVIVQAGPQARWGVDAGQYLIVKGHGLVTAARAAGASTIVADVLAADYPEQLALAYLVADNELARLGVAQEDQLSELVMDMSAMNSELALLMAGSEERLAELVDALSDDMPEAAEPQVDRAEELREQWGVEVGQLWEIPGRAGIHLLMCGDSGGDIMSGWGLSRPSLPAACWFGPIRR